MDDLALLGNPLLKLVDLNPIGLHHRSKAIHDGSVSQQVDEKEARRRPTAMMM